VPTAIKIFQGRAVNLFDPQRMRSWRYGIRLGKSLLMRSVRRMASVLVLATCAPWVAIATAEEKSNPFGDPFVAITRGLQGCPVPEGPLLTESEARAEAHSRAERGTSCFHAGRCRLPNAYLYDKEIIPRVAKALVADGRFADTSVWAMGRRRWVWLMGCVASAEQSMALQHLVRSMDDVEAVINQLMVGRHGVPAYSVAKP